MIAARVVQVFAPSSAQVRGRVSSGVVLAPGLVLTARHAVDGCESDPEVRLLDGDPEWHVCEVAWLGEGECDAAVLRTRAADALRADGALRLGRLVGERRVGSLRAVGFPWAQVVTGERNAVDTEAIEAAVDPLSGRAPGHAGSRLVVHIDGSVPTDRTDGGSPWEGMSGAALLRDDVVVGVIAGDPGRFGPDRLYATPASALAADPAFCAVAPVELADVELLGLVQAPYKAARTAGAAIGLARLLDSRAEIVAFHGREDELAAFDAWCYAEPRLSVALIAGPGGIGKTRLASELCHRVQATGSVAGFWNPKADPRAMAAVAAEQTTVLVVDEAHTMPTVVAELLLTQAQRTAGGPVRVILLARNAADWWMHTVADAVADDPVATAACEAAAMMAIRPVATDAADRREAFLEAARDLRAALAPEADATDPEVPDLSGPEFDAILYIQLAAGRAVVGDGGVAIEGPEELLAWALEREGRYWRATAAAGEPPLQVDRSVLERAVAVATLAVADTEDEAAVALAAIPDLAESARDRRAVARWLRHLYPHVEGDSWLPGLMPDELGDALVRAVLGESPSIARGLLDDPSPEQARSVLRVLERAGRGDGAVAGLLEELVSDRLAALWPAALDVAGQSEGGLGAMLGRALAREADPSLAAEILAAIPDRTVALRELAEVAARLAVDGAREAARADAKQGPALAEALHRHAVRLSDLARFEEALGVAEEAVALHREIGAEDPESARRLAATLGGLANRSTSLGRHEDALRAGQEAVDLLRAIDDDSPGSRLQLGWALSQLSSDLGGVGRIDEALGAAQEAVGILEALLDATGADIVAAKLAGAYTNLSNRLSQRDRHEEACRATQLSVALYRGLSTNLPGSYQEELARALANWVVDLRQVGAPDTALQAASEAVARFRELDAQVPGAFRSQLAHALASYSLALSDFDRADEALRATAETVELRRELADRHPGALDADLAEALTNLAIDLRTVGREQEAEAAIGEAQAILARLGGG